MVLRIKKKHIRVALICIIFLGFGAMIAYLLGYTAGVEYANEFFNGYLKNCNCEQIFNPSTFRIPTC